jgi:hypothetical protein
MAFVANTGKGARMREHFRPNLEGRPQRVVPVERTPTASRMECPDALVPMTSYDAIRTSPATPDDARIMGVEA